MLGVVGAGAGVSGGYFAWDWYQSPSLPDGMDVDTLYVTGNELNGHPVKLVIPTDFEIFEAMSDEKRQTATNLGEIVDKSSRYMNNRLAELAGDGLVRKVGPAENSHMSVITEKGRPALEHRDKYAHNSADEFGQFLTEKLEGNDE